MLELFQMPGSGSFVAHGALEEAGVAFSAQVARVCSRLAVSRVREAGNLDERPPRR